MPIYEYACADCGAEFEELVVGSEQPACPRCASARAERRVSVFAARTEGVAPDLPPAGAGGCGTCGDPRGPGACSLD